jgi:3-oxoacyl-[acyl-carrier protein] reductase
MRLADKIAIITGSGSGIGRATALLFAREGAGVVVSDINDTGGYETVRRIEEAPGRAIYLHADISSASEIDALVHRTLDTFGRIDILVNNAGIAEGDNILDIDELTWDRNLDIVLKGVFLCTKAVLPTMIARRSGSIINISSVNGLTGIGAAAYSAAKSGILSLTKTTAVRHGKDGIRVNAICPGTIRTEIWEPILARHPDIFDRLAALYPLRRVGRPEDIAYAALFLASDESSFATGSVFVIDGGLTAGSVEVDALITSALGREA